MHLAPGFTRFHGIILEVNTARDFRNMERRLRKYIDEGEVMITQSVLTDIKYIADDNESLRQLSEIIRADADARWREKWGRSWGEDYAARLSL